MGVSWFGSRARQDRVNYKAKGISLSRHEAYFQISTQKMQGKEANEDSQQKPREARSQRLW